MRSTLIAVLVGLAALVGGCRTFGGSAHATRAFSLIKPWQEYERIVVRSQNGRVQLAVADGPEILIEGKTRVSGWTQGDAESNLDQLTVTAGPDEAHAGTFLVELEVPEGFSRNSPGADFVIAVPRACVADVRTSNGSVHITGLKGPVVLDTSNGEIVVEDVKGSVQAGTSNGRLVARNVVGDLAADTSNGVILVEDVSGKCVLRTSNGAVTATATSGDLDVRTTNAKIRVEAAPNSTGSFVLETSNGPIYAMLPAQIAAEISLNTSNGKVDAAFGDIPLKVQRMSSRHVSASMNGGGADKIVADTSNASITLKFR